MDGVYMITGVKSRLRRSLHARYFYLQACSDFH